MISFIFLIHSFIHLFIHSIIHFYESSVSLSFSPLSLYVRLSSLIRRIFRILIKSHLLHPIPFQIRSKLFSLFRLSFVIELSREWKHFFRKFRGGMDRGLVQVGRDITRWKGKENRRVRKERKRRRRWRRFVSKMVDDEELGERECNDGAGGGKRRKGVD